MHTDEHEQALHQLEDDGLIARGGGVVHTTKRWQGAMARAALRLYESGDPGEDLRTPIAFALLELYGPDLLDDELARYVETMLPVEAKALGLGTNH